MKAIYRRELRAYFTGATGYVFLAIFLIISGYLFVAGNLMSADSDIRTFFANFLYVLIFLVPMLTMRLLAEEKKIKTDQLLLTSPVSLWGIVGGKYLAAMTVFGIGLGVTLVYPITIWCLGYVNVAVTLGNYLGIIMIVSAFVSIGLFLSSLTENQIIAAVLSYVCIAALLFVSWLQSAVSNEFVAKVFSWLSILSTYQTFTVGLLNPATILYYISLSGLFLFLTVYVLERRRWN